MSKQFLTLLLLIASLFSFSQNIATIANSNSDAMLFGDVKDSETGEHIPFANIIVKGTSIGTSTDASGHYMFNDLPEGEITLEASTLGYKSQSITITTQANSSKEVYFSLKIDAIMTEQVVVSASRNEMSRKEAPVIVSALTPKHIEAIAANTVADGLNFTPGLRVESNCQNCGFTQLRMNGLEGAYSQILVNSRPVFSGLAGVYGLEQIPTEMVERIEIVRGGGSAIFGGNAIAGTVNIITKDPINNIFQASIKGSAIGVGTENSGNTAYEKKTDFNGSIVSDNRKAGIFLFGTHRERDAWDANGDGFSEIVKLKNTSTGFQAFYKPSDISRISIEYHNLTEYRRGGDKLDYLPHEANIAEMLDHNNNSGGITYEVFTNKESMDKISFYASAQHVERESYYGANMEHDSYGYTTGLTAVGGVQYVSNYSKFLSVPGTLILGLENLNDRINDIKLGANGDANSTIADQTINTSGSYAQYQMNFARFKFLFGFRVDHYRIENHEDELGLMSGTVFNPRGNLLFDLSESTQLRVSYSTGYRAPQIFNEDLHIEASGARRIEHKNSPDLEEERSQSFSGSFRYNKSIGKWDMEFLVEGFFTDLQNPFINELSNDGSGLVTSVRKNTTSAKVYGTNIELTLAPSRKFYAQLGGTIQSSIYDQEQRWGEIETNTSVYITRSPSSYAYAIVNYEPTKKFSFSFSGNYTGSMYVPHLSGGDQKDGSVKLVEELFESETFFIVNLKAAYKARITNQVYAECFMGIKNILNSYQSNFDYGVNRDAGFTYGPMEPRTIYAGVKIKM